MSVKVRKSIQTKNQLVQENINKIIQNQIKFKYFVMDSWFACNETLELINKHKYFVVPLKSNRKIALSKANKIRGIWSKLEDIKSDDKPIEVWLEALSSSTN